MSPPRPVHHSTANSSPAPPSELDALFMARAIELAARGEGLVEPNPMVGCVVVRDGAVVGEGWHQRFGQAHAEVEALASAGSAARGATAYVTLEPCCHHGKTPPCTRALIAAGVTRVVCAMRDPFPAVAGDGMAELAAAGIAVEAGLLEADARRLNAPYLKLVETGRPWVIAKWAMTLDGKIATHRGDSQWISSEPSRAVVHTLRGRVDAIVVGRGTAERDDPLLTARPRGPRVATRVVVDRQASLAIESQLVQTAREAPVLVVAASDAPAGNVARLQAAGCEVWQSKTARNADSNPATTIGQLLDELGRRRMTNVLVEGGGQLLGAMFDAGVIDEVHVFVAPKLIGGEKAITPLAGQGVATMTESLRLADFDLRRSGDDVYLWGRIDKSFLMSH